MPSVSEVASLASLPTSIGLSMMKVPNPYVAAAGAALSLVGLVDKIGQGRKAANKMTGNGGPQDILNKQLAAISASQSSPEEKAQATERAWRGFLTAANEFAAANPKQAQVVKQAIYQTPGLTNTVKNLLGKDPLSTEYTSVAQVGMDKGFAGKNPGPSVLGSVLRAGVSAATPFVMDKLMGSKPIGGGGDTGWDPTTGQPTIPVAGGPAPGVQIPGAPPTNAPGGNSLLQRLMPQIISGGTSLIGGIVASRAANQAANTQADAATRAAELEAEAGRNALDFNREVFQQQQANLQPWLTAGTNALTEIGQMQDFKLPTFEEAMSDPGIQFQLDRGRKIVEASMRAKGLAFSPAAFKELDERSQGIAATGYGDVVNRRLVERQTNLNRLMALAGIGQDSTTQLNANLGNVGAQNADITINTARGVGQATQNAGAARASGYAGAGNIWGSTFANIGNNVLDQAVMDQYMRARPISVG